MVALVLACGCGGRCACACAFMLCGSILYVVEERRWKGGGGLGAHVAAAEAVRCVSGRPFI